MIVLLRLGTVKYGLILSRLNIFWIFQVTNQKYVEDYFMFFIDIFSLL